MCDESVFIHHYGSQTFKANQIDYQKNLKDRLKLFHEKWPDVDYTQLLELENPLDQYLPELFQQADENVRVKQYERALDQYRKISMIDPLNMEARFGELHTLMKAGRQIEALTIAKDMLRDDPENTEILLETGKILLAMGLQDKAKVIFEKLIILDSSHAEAKKILSEIKYAKSTGQSGANGAEISPEISKEDRTFVNTASSS